MIRKKSGPISCNKSRPCSSKHDVNASRSPFARLSALVFAGILFAACSTSPLSRIDADRARYESWPLEVQEAVLQGKARKGMTAEQVEMALGKPTQVVARSAKAGEDEVWIYRKSGGLGSALGNTGVSLGGGVGGVSVGTGVGGIRRGETPEEIEVVFAKGVVVRSDSDK